MKTDVSLLAIGLFFVFIVRRTVMSKTEGLRITLLVRSENLFSTGFFVVNEYAATAVYERNVVKRIGVVRAVGLRIACLY